MEIKSQIKHFSYSALRSFMASPYKFWKNYVMREKFKPSLSMAAGKAWHIGLESFYRKEEDYIEKAYNSLESASGKLLDTLEGEAREKMEVKIEKELKDLKNNLEIYPEQERAWEPTGEIEIRVATDSPVDGGLPIVGVIDIIDTVVCPVDHKYVSRFTTGQKEKYYVQAWFYYYLTKALKNEYPKYFLISEFKKTKNRDKSPQLKEIVIVYDKKWLKKVDNWYKEMCDCILKAPHYPANPFQLDNIDDWYEYLNS